MKNPNFVKKICMLLIVLTILEKVDNKRNKRKKGQGIYEIIDTINQEVVYIGVTNNFGRREYEHKKSKYKSENHQFNIKETMENASRDDMNLKEKQYINTCQLNRQCIDNKRAGGGGRR